MTLSAAQESALPQNGEAAAQGKCVPDWEKTHNRKVESLKNETNKHSNIQCLDLGWQLGVHKFSQDERSAR